MIISLSGQGGLSKVPPIYTVIFNKLLIIKRKWKKEYITDLDSF